MKIDATFQIIAAGILATFFVVFFGKMIAQKRKGMKTGLLKRGNKSPKVFVTELVLKVFVFLIFTAQVVSIWFNIHTNYLSIRILGAAIGMTGVSILAIAIVTMRDSWRTEIPESEHIRLVTGGVFRFSRNPAFLGFDMMFAGVLAMFFNPVLAALTACCIVMYHLQIIQEEKYLTSVFGTAYTDYMSRTKRYFGQRAEQRSDRETKH